MNKIRGLIIVGRSTKDLQLREEIEQMFEEQAKIVPKNIPSWATLQLTEEGFSQFEDLI